MRFWVALPMTAVMILARGMAYASGETIFVTNCVVCHQPGGHGVPGVYPPLAGNVGRYAQTPEGREYLVHVLVYGLNGPIKVHDVQYNGFMQPWPQLGNDSIAEVLNHVLTKFDGSLLPKDFHPFTAEEVKRLRAKPLSNGNVHKERSQVIRDLTARGAAR